MIGTPEVMLSPNLQIFRPPIFLLFSTKPNETKAHTYRMHDPSLETDSSRFPGHEAVMASACVVADGQSTLLEIPRDERSLISGSKSDETTSQLRRSTASGALDDLMLDLHLDPAEVVSRIRLEIEGSAGSDTPSIRSGSHSGQRTLGARLAVKEQGFADEKEMRLTQSTNADAPDSNGIYHSPKTSSAQGAADESRSSHFLGSNVSSRNFLLETLPEPSVKPRRVRFANEIEKVVVYEVDNAAWVDIKFKRNPIGWVIILVLFASFLGFDLYDKFGHPDMENPDMFFVWTALWRVVVYLILVLCGLMSGIGDFSMKDFKVIFQSKTNFLILAGQFLFYSIESFSRIFAERLDKAHEIPEYGPSTCLFLLLFFVIRYLRSQQTFLLEWVVAILLLSCSFVAAEPMFTSQKNPRAVFYSNCVWCAYSVFRTIEMMFVERSRKITDSILVRVLPSILAGVVWNTLYAVGDGHFDPDLSKMFSQETLVPVVVMGTIQSGIILSVVAVVLYLDIVSLASAYFAKAIVGYYLHLWIFNKPGHEAAPPLPWVIASTACMLILCLVIVIFASERRRWVAHRLGG
jgi:hypothetical protein